MKAFCYLGNGKLGWADKPEPKITDARDAIVRVTMSSICTSDLHIKGGFVPRAKLGVTLGHELVGVVEQTGRSISGLRAGDRVAVNVETFCGECFFCRRGWVNNCESDEGGWAIGCRIDGAQAKYIRVPFADTGLTLIPDGVTDKQALLTGDVLVTGYWAATLAEISEGDTVLVIGGGPVGICCGECARLKGPARVIVCEADAGRRRFIAEHFPALTAVPPSGAVEYVRGVSAHGGADAVIEAAGGAQSFEMAYTAARPNAVVVIAAMYESGMTLPLPDMYGKNLVFKTGGVDGHYCKEELSLIAEGKLDVSPLITHVFGFKDLEAAYELFSERRDGVMKVGITM